MDARAAGVWHHLIRQGPQWVWAITACTGFLLGRLPLEWFIPMAVIGAGLKTLETVAGRRETRTEER